MLLPFNIVFHVCWPSTMKLFLLLLDISNFDTVTNHNVNFLEIEVCWAGCGPQDEDHCNIRLRYAGPLCGQSIARGYTKLRNVLARSRLYYKKKRSEWSFAIWSFKTKIQMVNEWIQNINWYILIIIHNEIPGKFGHKVGK